MKKWILISLLIVAFLLRVVSLDKFPVGFTPDEASFGYDAYSILKTGKDQWGNILPLTLKSFGDYKAPLYAYLTIPFVAILDLNRFSVRLPNAILGSLAVLVVYLLANEIEKRKASKFNLPFGIIPALLLTLSPWHIMMSRGAFEANLITFFVPLGILLFLKNKYFGSALVLGLSMFTYHSAKVIAPLIFLGLLIIFWKGIKPKIKLFGAIATFTVFVVLTFYSFTLGAGARVKDVNVFAGAVEEGSNAKYEAIKSGEPYFVAKLLHNKYTVSLKRFTGNYVKYFSTQFYLTEGASETTYGMLPGYGVLTIVEFVGLIFFVGFYFSQKEKKLLNLLLFWLLIAPIPASLATGSGYAANRAVSMHPGIQVVASLGLIFLFELSKFAKPIIAAILVLSFLCFFENYFILSPIKLSSGMLEGNLEASYYIKDNSDKYNEIVVSRLLSEPHIYVAFATKYDPLKYQETINTWGFDNTNLKFVDQIGEYRLGKYNFRTIDPKEEKDVDTLYIGKPQEFGVKDTPFLKMYGTDNDTPNVVVFNKSQ